eukprot:3218446-Pyramimonas_sp.AAC.1
MAQPTSGPAVIGCPGNLADRNVSDRAAHVVCISQRALKPARSHRIPRRLFEAQGFQQQLKVVCDKLSNADKSPPRQIELRKWAVREVALDYRDRLLRQAPESNTALVLLARQMSRVVWRTTPNWPTSSSTIT